MTSLETLADSVYEALAAGLKSYGVTVLRSGLPSGQGTRRRPQVGFRFVDARADLATLEVVVQAAGEQTGEAAVYKYADLVDNVTPGEVDPASWSFGYDQDDAMWRAIGTAQAARTWPIA